MGCEAKEGGMSDWVSVGPVETPWQMVDLGQVAGFGPSMERAGCTRVVLRCGEVIVLDIKASDFGASMRRMLKKEPNMRDVDGVTGQ